jgi:hypothetical protein
MNRIRRSFGFLIVILSLSASAFAQDSKPVKEPGKGPVLTDEEFSVTMGKVDEFVTQITSGVAKLDPAKLNVTYQNGKRLETYRNAVLSDVESLSLLSKKIQSSNSIPASMVTDYAISLANLTGSVPALINNVEISLRDRQKYKSTLDDLYKVNLGLLSIRTDVSRYAVSRVDALEQKCGAKEPPAQSSGAPPAP